MENENQTEIALIEKIRNKITEPEFVKKHHEKNFIRRRKLDFTMVLLIILQKSVRSLQNILNDLYEQLNSQTVTASAFTQARKHLKHTAFIELNKECIINTCYQNNNYKTSRNFRVLAGDGSRIILPKHPSIYDDFGSIAIKNGEQQTGDYTSGISFVLHDVLNKVVISSSC